MLSTQLKESFAPLRKDGSQLDNEKAVGKRRSLSDCVPPVLSPSPKFREPEKRAQDDLQLDSPMTPRRPTLQRGMSLQMPAKDLMTTTLLNPAPLSPKLDQADTYGSPAGSIPRRSRGLDFSRAATNLHHSTLADTSPDGSPTTTGRAMAIPNRRSGQFGSGENGGSSLWSSMSNSNERNPMSSSLGSVNMMDDSTDSSSGDEDLMDADEIDESLITTPQLKSMGAFGITQASPGNWLGAPSPAVNSLMNFQQRHRLRPKHRKNNVHHSMNSPMSRSPPLMRSIEGVGRQDDMQRRESISWAANQLRISGNESDDGSLRNTLESSDGMPNTPNRDGRPGVIRRVVTRRGNMLPKTKGFARIRAALAEEGAPVETEVRREADVIRQVREAEPDLEPTRHSSVSHTAQSSPMFGPAVLDALEEIPEDDIMGDGETSAPNFKAQVMKNSKGKEFWDSFDRDHTPPFLPRHSSSGISNGDISDTSMMTPPLFQMPSIERTETQSSSGRSSATPQPSLQSMPSAAEISRKANGGKRRRDDDFDFDLGSFKRRAVSPGMSVNGSPVLGSPAAREGGFWGATQNRAGEKVVKDIADRVEEAKRNANGGGGATGTLKRVGFQGMENANDGLMNMSIE